MAKPKAKQTNGGKSSQQQGASPPTGKTKAQPARAGKPWLLSLLAVLCVGGVGLWIVKPFARPDRKEIQADPPRETLTSEALKEEMIEVARGQMADFPDDPVPVVLMGIGYAIQGQYTEAMRWYQRALDMNPHFAEAHGKMAEIAIARGEFELAIERCRKALAIDPDLAGANGRLGDAFMELGRPEDAVAALKTELEHHPEAIKFEFSLGQAYLQLKQYEEALPHLERAVKGMPSYLPAYYALAKAHARLGQRDEAAEFTARYRQLRDAEVEAKRENTQEDVDFPNASRAAAEIHTRAGKIYSARGRTRSAIEHWQRAAFLNRRNVECRELLSDSYMRQQRWSEVLDLQRELKGRFPDYPVYHLNEGVVLFYLGKLDESERAFRQGIRLAPELASGYHSLLQVLMHGDRKLPEAKAVAEKLVELEPTARNYTLLGGLCRKTGDEAGARAAEERSLQLDLGGR